MVKRTAGGNSSLRTPGRHITIVTTAALPWMTGTSVNPLLRAAYLESALKDAVIQLLVPWVSAAEQDKLFPDSLRMDSPEHQVCLSYYSNSLFVSVLAVARGNL